MCTTHYGVPKLGPCVCRLYLRTDRGSSGPPSTGPRTYYVRIGWSTVVDPTVSTTTRDRTTKYIRRRAYGTGMVRVRTYYLIEKCMHTNDIDNVLPSPEAANETSQHAYIAMGILSTASDKYRRRDKIRSVSSGLSNLVHGSFVLRFIVSVPCPVPRQLAAEASFTHDLVLLNMSETPFRCALKYLLWFSFALREFPSVQWLGAGDDDAYVQFEHMEADLRHISLQTKGRPSLWGLIMWRPYYNNMTMDTTSGFTVRSLPHQNHTHTPHFRPLVSTRYRCEIVLARSNCPIRCLRAALSSAVNPACCVRVHRVGG